MTTTRTLHLADETATRRLGETLARLARPGDVLALAGDLGAGKTTLARAFVQALAGAEEEVPSPTFTLVQTYDGPDCPLWHFDLYRLERAEECFELGIEEALADGIVLIEWPERMGSWLPPRRLDLILETLGPDGARAARLISRGQWDERLEEVR
jgi:tRNA threonylcarbamoyladenosine biosynthesis protein TsaE